MAVPTHYSTDGEAYGSAAVITPSDATLIGQTARAIYVGVAGNITALFQDGSAVLLSNVPIGIHRLRVNRINATATTATNMVALF